MYTNYYFILPVVVTSVIFIIRDVEQQSNDRLSRITGSTGPLFSLTSNMSLLKNAVISTK